MIDEDMDNEEHVDVEEDDDDDSTNHNMHTVEVISNYAQIGIAKDGMIVLHFQGDDGEEVLHTLGKGLKPLQKLIDAANRIAQQIN